MEYLPTPGITGRGGGGELNDVGVETRRDVWRSDYIQNDLITFT